MIDELIARIVAEVGARLPPGPMTTRIVAVDGLGGSGKSTFAARLARAFGAQVAQTDDFASWEEPVDWWPRLVAELLEPLSRNEIARFRRSSWGGPERREFVVVDPGGVVVLEGVTASRAAFRPYLTYSIWIETPPELRLRRGLERDGEAAREQWLAWMAAEDAYRAREQPDERADLVVRGDVDLWT